MAYEPKDGEETEEIEVRTVWHATSRIEVPKGWRPTSYLHDFPEGTLDEVDCSNAELVDWS